MARRGMARTRTTRSSSSASQISIGNCKVAVDGKNFVCDSNERSLTISVSGARISVSVDDSRQELKSKDEGKDRSLLEDHVFELVNPKDGDSQSKSLIQEILKIYMTELPMMNYAANTGKKSSFLERCISSGKYRSLLLKSILTNGFEEVRAAVSYQIIPADTQYAEIPLAAVRSNYQKKGIGQLLYKELRERLLKVGVSKILCWGDKESEGFWLKQGFITIGEVDSKGKARRLPIKADIRRALCFPGGSTLMIAHLNKHTGAGLAKASIATSPKNDYLEKPSIHENQIVEAQPLPMENCCHIENSPNNDYLEKPLIQEDQIGETQHLMAMENGCHIEKQEVEGINPIVVKWPSDTSIHWGNISCGSIGIDNKYAAKSGKGVKRQSWEFSLSALKSKRVRGGHFIDHCQYKSQDIACDHGRMTCASGGSSLMGLTFVGSHAEGNNAVCDGLLLESLCPKVMFMNIADETKKTWLAKVVEDLGGLVTCDGSACTHVITGKARRTLNFCIALCSGAWVISPKWLKASFKEGKFVGEDHYILEDEDYFLRYKCKLRDAVLKAKKNSHSMLRGYDLCLARHIQPSIEVLSSIIRSAGGNVISKLGNIKESSRTIFLACEKDMEEALVAAKNGVWTFSSDWFMTCVMKQELDFDAPQFAESL